MNIAQRVITKCGGYEKTAAITERTVSVVYRWTYEKSKGGTGGLIPADAQQKIMAAASRKEVDILASDFFEPNGEDIQEVAS